MKSYGLDLQYTDVNAIASAVNAGAQFPDSPRLGSLFFLSTQQGSHMPGHYTFNGTDWITGDISSVTAGYGLLGGGPGGDVTLSLDSSIVVTSNDVRINYTNVKVVRKIVGIGQYGSIADAMDSITDNALENQYLIDVGPGIYDERQVVCKSFTLVRGTGPQNTIIRPIDPDKHLFVGAPRAGVINCSISGATGIGSAGIYNKDPLGSTQLYFYVGNVKFGRNYVHVQCDAGYVQVDGCVYGGIYSFNKGFVVNDDGVHPSRIMVRNSTTTGMTAPYPSVVFEAVGTMSQILVASSFARASASQSTSSNVGVGLHLANGGRCRVLATSLTGFAKGIWVENVGAAPIVSCTGMNLESNNLDLVIDHPGTTGSFNGGAARAKVIVNPSATISVLYSDLEQQGTVGIGPLYLGSSHNTLANVAPLITRGVPLGIMDGGILSRGTGLNALVSAGNGYIRVGTNLIQVSWPDSVIPVAANATQYLYVDATSTIRVALSAPDQNNNVILGRLLGGSSSIVFIGAQGSTQISSFLPNLDRFNKYALGPLYVSGSIVTASTTTPRAVNVTAGHYFVSAAEYFPNALTAAVVLVGAHANGAPALFGVAQIPNTQYDNGTNLVALPAGYYTKHGLYTTGDAANVGLVLAHGTGSFATLLEAQTAPLPAPIFSPDGSPIIASIIMRQGTDSIIEITDVRPRVGFAAAASGGVTSHGDLLGLAGDDHTQYFRADGTRKMLGNLDMNGSTIINAALINGLAIDAHGARHTPNGADPLPTAAPTVGISTLSTLSAGVANSFARSDHSHSLIGVQAASVDLTAIAGINVNGLIRRTSAGTWTGASTVSLATEVTGNLSTARLNSGTGATGTTFWRGDGTWATPVQNITYVGDATGTGSTAVTLTLANTGTATGTFNNVTVNSKGLITAAANVAYLTANQTITYSGDLSGSGTTAVTLTLPNTGVTAGTYNNVTVNAKGLVTGASNVSYLTANQLITVTGDVTGAGTTSLPLTLSATGVSAGTYRGGIVVDTKGRISAINTPTALSATGINTIDNIPIGNTVASTGSFTTMRISGVVDQTLAGGAASLTNPTYQATNSVNGYTQVSIQNRSTGVSASADFIAYPDNVTLSDLSGFMDMGITSSGFSDSAYSVTGQNEGYLFMSAPSGAGKTGNMIIATDSTGTVNDIVFATNGFQTLANRRMIIKGLTGNVLVGTATDDGVNRLQVTGSIKASGAIIGSNVSGTNTGDQTITLTGDATGSGTGNLALTLANSGVVAGTYNRVTTDSKGRVTSGTNPTTLVGYGITDAVNVSQLSSANTASTVVTRDTSGNFSAGTITATLAGNATSATHDTGGVAGAIRYQSAVNTSGFSAAGTAGQILLSGGAFAPTWVNQNAITLQSSQVTNALGFTPYNATNPANYITSAGAPVQSVAGRTGAVTLVQADVGGLTTASSPSFAAVSATTFTGALVGNATTATTTTNDAGGVAGAIRYQSAVNTSGFSAAGVAGQLLVSGGVGTPTWINQNGITLQSSQVTSALGYTPYNATNPANYITSAGAPVQSVAGRAGAVVLTSTDVGLNNLTNSLQVINGGSVPSMLAGTFATMPAAGTYGRLYLATDTKALYRDNGTSWDLMQPTITGDIAVAAGSSVATLSNTGVVAGLYDRINVDSKGRVTSGTLSVQGNTQHFAGNVPQQSGTTSITNMITAPDTTSGTALFSQTITPTTLGSKFIICMTAMVDASSTNSQVVMAVFRNTTFIGLTATSIKQGGAPDLLTVNVVDSPNTSSPVTYTIRVGAGAPATIWYVGRTITNTYGGVNNSGWTIREVL